MAPGIAHKTEGKLIVQTAGSEVGISRELTGQETVAIDQTKISREISPTSEHQHSPVQEAIQQQIHRDAPMAVENFSEHGSGLVRQTLGKKVEGAEISAGYSL
jgi:hypothetical protein